MSSNTDTHDASAQTLHMLPQDVVRSRQLDLDSLRSQVPTTDSFLHIGPS